MSSTITQSTHFVSRRVSSLVIVEDDLSVLERTFIAGFVVVFILILGLYGQLILSWYRRSQRRLRHRHQFSMRCLLLIHNRLSYTENV